METKLTETDLKTVYRNTQAVYNRVAGAYDAQRQKTLFEKPWLDKFLAALPTKPTVLDLGCGTGEPIAQYLIGQGARLTGVDYAPEMLAIARERFRGHVWIEADMRSLDVQGRFDGVLSWHGFFHLDQAEQRETLPQIASLVRAGGAMMFTIGPDESEVAGKVDGHPVYHASLAPETYRTILKEAGFSAITVKIEDPGCNRSSIVLATNKKN